MHMNDDKFDTCCARIFVFSVVPIGISIICIIFSKLWIMITKASKVCNKAYENALARISKIDEFWNDKSIKDIYRDKIKEFKFWNSVLDRKAKHNTYLLSTQYREFCFKNIMIEIVFLFVFIESHIVHIIWTIYLLVHTYKDYLKNLWCCFLCYSFYLAYLLLYQKEC